MLKKKNLTHKSKQIHVNKAESLIRYKFELVYKIKAIELLMESREYRVFEN